MNKISFLITLIIIALVSCQTSQDQNREQENMDKAPFRFMILAPGHFHAGLVLKNMYPSVDSTVYLYAPEGLETEDFLERIKQFNTREDQPTAWVVEIYRGPDYLEKMIKEKPGNVMITAGNNKLKTEYIRAAIDAGINVLADKPMAIDVEDFELLKASFEAAEDKNILLYDIMTERYEISTILQKEFSQIAEIFGQLQTGSPDEPAVTKESVHHFSKVVSGKPLVRPAWFFDVSQQGEGIVDVTTHLVDLIQWGCYPEQIINYETEVDIVDARRWPTELTPEQFNKVTNSESYPEYLLKDVLDDSLLNVYANGEITYRLKDTYAKVSVIWNYEAPEGGGDTHYSIMRGSKANLVIRQGEEQNYKPELYIEPVGNVTLDEVEEAVNNNISQISGKYEGVSVIKEENRLMVQIPDELRKGHEAHFGQVTEKYLDFLKQNSMPEWEVPNMLAKYYITTHALEVAKIDQK